jgi:predicted membrane channel-forming protein YqfA (hemolysin III family)
MQYQLALLGLDSLTLVLYHAMPTEAGELQQVIRMMDYCGPATQRGLLFLR